MNAVINSLDYLDVYLQSWTNIVWTTAKNGVVTDTFHIPRKWYFLANFPVCPQIFDFDCLKNFIC